MRANPCDDDPREHLLDVWSFCVYCGRLFDIPLLLGQPTTDWRLGLGTFRFSSARSAHVRNRAMTVVIWPSA